MRVELDNELFRQSVSPAKLFTLVLLGLEGRHRLMVLDDQEESFLAWQSDLPAEQQVEWELCLREAYELESREPAERAMHVSIENASADWASKPPKVPLGAAVSHLRQPFVAFLEDSESDRAFLLSVATPEQSTFLLKMEEMEALRFEHGGGISNMPRRLASWLGTKGSHLRFWVLFDSDGLQPGTWSEDAERLAQVCEEAGIPFHRLQRRAIENYLPDAALRDWAWNPHNAARKKIVRAFRRLSPEQRSHYNMKAGFRRDARRNDATAGSLFDNVNEADVETLADGFGDSVGDLFSKHEISEQNLEEEGSWDELSHMVARLVSLIR